jgi:hypothetical protein
MRIDRRAFLVAAVAFARRARAEDLEVAARARWIAGMSSSVAKPPDWQAYATSEDERWARTRETRLAPMQEYADRELAPLLGREPVVFYPFAGPDAMHAIALFGTARRYLLVGLEPPGTLPDPQSVPRGFFARLGAAMSDVHRLSFFRTQEMASDFKADGVAATLLATIARMNGAVSSVHITATKVTIEWSGRRLDYVQADLSNSGLQQKPQLVGQIEALGAHAAFVKAAMYLLAEPRFSSLRGLILGNASLVVQDDTGIPFRSFDGTWTTRLFGRYETPRPPFEERFQPELRAAYDRRSPAPLGFGIGYAVEAKRSNLLIASKVRA